ncbi:glycine-rich domain-containing protein [Streptomyces sp. T028]|uniref:glycine-rich domain-containing protein n=1 Tax=Streptomyces sp. T028 TaxID=3394379 RepID=UPI003A84BC60
MQTSTPQAAAATKARDLIPAEAFAGVAATVLDNNQGMDQALAERITEEAIKFVATCAAFPGRGLRPSRIVDEGWHALILHTTVYQRLCRSEGGFVHHVPERPDPSRHNPGELERTKDAIREAGFSVDEMLWLAPTDTTISVAADCEHTGGNCANCMDGGSN